MQNLNSLIEEGLTFFGNHIVGIETNWLQQSNDNNKQMSFNVH